MKKLMVLASMLLLAGCSTTAIDMLEQEPQLRLSAISSKGEFRDCVFRWMDNRAIRLQDHPDGIWARDSLMGSPILFTAHSEGEVALYLSWQSKGKWGAYSDMVKKCNAEPDSLPPDGFFLY